MTDSNVQYRTTELLVDGALRPIEFEELKEGDVFAMREPDGTPVDEGELFTAAEDAFYNEGCWGIMVKK